MSPVAATKAGLGSRAAISLNIAASICALGGPPAGRLAPTWMSEQWMKVKSARTGEQRIRAVRSSIVARATCPWRAYPHAPAAGGNSNRVSDELGVRRHNEEPLAAASCIG